MTKLSDLNLSDDRPTRLADLESTLFFLTSAELTESQFGEAIVFMGHTETGEPLRIMCSADPYRLGIAEALEVGADNELPITLGPLTVVKSGRYMKIVDA